MARFIFSLFSFPRKKKNSPVHRSWGKIVQWKSKRIRDVSHCLELAFVIRSEEKSALRRRLDRNCTNANRFEQKTVRKYGPIVTRISEILPCCFSVFLESQNFHELILVREILEFLRRREESFWKIYPFWTRSNASISDRIREISSLNFFSIKLKWSKVNQIWQINLQNSKDEKGIVAYILLSFPRVSLLYLSNELFFQEQLQYSPHKMQEGWVGSRLRWKRETATRELWEAKWSSQ